MFFTKRWYNESSKNRREDEMSHRENILNKVGRFFYYFIFFLCSLALIILVSISVFVTGTEFKNLKQYHEQMDKCVFETGDYLKCRKG